MQIHIEIFFIWNCRIWSNLCHTSYKSAIASCRRTLKERKFFHTTRICWAFSIASVRPDGRTLSLAEDTLSSSAAEDVSSEDEDKEESDAKHHYILNTDSFASA